MIKQILFIVHNLALLPILMLKRSKVSLHARLSSNLLLSNTTVGAYTYIGKGVIVNDTKIGRYCSIAAGSQIGAMDHSWGKIVTSTLLNDHTSNNVQDTYIGNGAWIGANSIIMRGIKIGEGAVIGANSFVKTDVPPYSIVVGSPAKVYKYRFKDNIIEKIEKSKYWECSPKKARKIILKLEKFIKEI